MSTHFFWRFIKLIESLLLGWKFIVRLKVQYLRKSGQQ